MATPETRAEWSAQRRGKHFRELRRARKTTEINGREGKRTGKKARQRAAVSQRGCGAQNNSCCCFRQTAYRRPRFVDTARSTLRPPSGAEATAKQNISAVARSCAAKRRPKSNTFSSNSVFFFFLYSCGRGEHRSKRQRNVTGSLRLRARGVVVYVFRPGWRNVLFILWPRAVGKVAQS